MFNIIYQDEFLLVLDKFPGVVVDPSNTQLTGTIAQALTEEYQIELDRGGIVHRLDKDTSGLLLVAKTQEALESLQAQFKERSVKKEYLCLVHGFLEGEGQIEGAIGRNPAHRETFIVTPNGKEALTLYKSEGLYEISDQFITEFFSEFSKTQLRKVTANSYSDFSLVRCFPQSGRTHQIRVHMKYLGFPLVGDEKYSGRKTYRLDHRWCPRQFLHSNKIEFMHPQTNKRLTFESPLPEDLQGALTKLKIKSN